MAKLFSKVKKIDKTTPSEKITLCEDTTAQDNWICPSCGAKMPRSVLSCKDCGKYR